MVILTVDGSEKTKPNKVNFKAQTTLKGVKRKPNTGFLRPDDDGRQVEWKMHGSSLVNHPSSFLPCLSPAGRRE